MWHDGRLVEYKLSLTRYEIAQTHKNSYLLASLGTRLTNVFRKVKTLVNDKNGCWRMAGGGGACGRDCRRHQSITSCTVGSVFP